MVRWRIKIKGKKKVNSVNGGREVDGGWSKKEKGKRQGSGGPKFQPPHLNSATNWINSVKLSWLRQPKKTNLFQNPNFQFKIFIPKFSILHSQCPNSKLKSLVFKKFKPQISQSKFKVSIFRILSFKILGFKFQISIQNLKVSKSQDFKWKFQNFQVSKIKCFSKEKSFVN